MPSIGRTLIKTLGKLEGKALSFGIKDIVQEAVESAATTPKILRAAQGALGLGDILKVSSYAIGGFRAEVPRIFRPIQRDVGFELAAESLGTTSRQLAWRTLIKPTLAIGGWSAGFTLWGSGLDMYRQTVQHASRLQASKYFYGIY